MKLNCRRLVFCLLLMIGAAKAQNGVATLRGDVLVVPAVTVGADKFRIELTILAGTDPIELSLTAVDSSVESNSNNSYFADNVLHVPAIVFEENIYSATFGLVTKEDPFTVGISIFRLLDVGVVPNHGALPDNRTPTAMFSVRPGNTPFEIIFDASQSFDPDGEIVQYVWDFGTVSNNTFRSAQTVNRVRLDAEPFSYLYEYANWESVSPWGVGIAAAQFLADNPPVFTARLQVTDDIGATHIFSSEVEIESIVAHAGQQALVDRIEQEGGWSGRIFIDEIPGYHSDRIEWKLLQEGVPAQHVGVSITGISRDTDPELLVRNISLLTPIRNEFVVDYIAESDEIIVIAAGNIDARHTTYCVDDNYPTPRDVWDRNHPYWTCTEARPGISQEWFDAMLNAVATGKVVIAVSVIREEDGSVSSENFSVTCGDMAEYCFSVTHAYDGTSFAAPRVAAALFHLRQFYGTSEEAVAAAKQCVEDVGEPGPDREFGLGVLDLTCPEATFP